MTFLKSESARKSYWARNFVGWPRWSSAPPNTAHVTLAKWERAKMLQHVITQNVDQLHFKVHVNIKCMSVERWIKVELV